jgi:hypothetical protein
VKVTHYCPNCSREYCGGETYCNECGHKTVPEEDEPRVFEKPEPPSAQIIDLFEALKQSLAPKKGGAK